MATAIKRSRLQSSFLIFKALLEDPRFGLFVWSSQHSKTVKNGDDCQGMIFDVALLETILMHLLRTYSMIASRMFH